MVDAAQPLSTPVSPGTILWIAAEIGPEAQVGGLGEVARTLPSLLRASGLDVRLCVPQHRALLQASKAHHSTLDVLGRRFMVGLGSRDSVPTYYMRCDELFDRSSVYGTIEDDAFRFSVFSKASVELAKQLGVSIVHAHDWQTALAPVLTKGSQLRSVLTVHNVAYQGVVSSTLIPALGLPWYTASEDGLGFGWQVINLLKGGVLAADLVTTVSKQHASDITTVEGGFGLHSVFTKRRSQLVGIMNGIDTVSWNPSTDPALFSTLDNSHMDVAQWKQSNRVALSQSLSWPLSQRPLITSIGRLVEQKGIDLLIDAAWQRADLDLLVIGVGEEGLQRRLHELQSAHPARVRVQLTYNEALSRRALAASDFFVMPSRFEPGGLAQLQALRYGAIPIVRRTGGLAESVTDMGEHGGNGICFSDASASSLSHALARAVELAGNANALSLVRAAALASNVGWQVSVPHYVALYRSLTTLSVG